MSHPSVAEPVQQAMGIILFSILSFLDELSLDDDEMCCS